MASKRSTLPPYKLVILIASLLFIAITFLVMRERIYKNYRVWMDKDGEGFAQIDKTYVTSNSRDHFTIIYTADDHGIDVGGSIAIGFIHPAKWRFGRFGKEQSQIRVTRLDTNAILQPKKNVASKMYRGRSTFKFKNGAFTRQLTFQIQDTPLLPGEQIQLEIGTAEHPTFIPKFSDPQHEFRISTDGDGDGIYKSLKPRLNFEIGPASATLFTASGPSIVQKGVPFPVTLRADDKTYNVDTNYGGLADIHDENGNRLASKVAFKNGIAKTSLNIDYVGPQRLRLSSQNGEIAGRSDPFKVVDELPENQIYWGDLHGHTSFSDGIARTMDEYFDYGRDVAALDVLALTDHGTPDWEQLQEVVATYHEPNKFVTILAQESGAIANHMNMYFRRDVAAKPPEGFDEYSEVQDHFYKNYTSKGEQVMMGPHHFAYERGKRNDDLYPFGIWDERVARFVEVYSVHGTSEFQGNPRPLNRPSQNDSKYMQTALNQGLKFGVIGASDSHTTQPGHGWAALYPNGLAAFMSPSLTRDSIWDAMWSYRTYATSFDRIYMELTLNEAPMGSSLETDKAVTFNGYIIGKTDNVKAALIKNGEIIKGFMTENGVIDFSFEDDPLPGEHYYYLRIEQDNGERAWSSPFWVTKR